MKTDTDLLYPVSHVQIVDRDLLKPNGYNPNVVSKRNLELLIRSIEVNGWTLPIVVRPDYTIIDGFHRWTVAGLEPLRTRLRGKVPVVVVDHADPAEDVYGTITHNRARGVHQLGPMKDIVRGLLDSGKTIQEVARQLGMSKEEVFRLCQFSREQFLQMMAEGVDGYSTARKVVSAV